MLQSCRLWRIGRLHNRRAPPSSPSPSACACPPLVLSLAALAASPTTEGRSQFQIREAQNNRNGLLLCAWRKKNSKSQVVQHDQDIPITGNMKIYSPKELRKSHKKLLPWETSLDRILWPCLPGIGIVTCGVKNDCDPALAILMEYIGKDDSNICIGAILLCLGIAYAGSQKEELKCIFLLCWVTPNHLTSGGLGLLSHCLWIGVCWFLQ